MDDIHYNQYDCISKSIVKRLDHEIGCKFPYHAFNKVLEEKKMCSNFSEYEGNLMMCLILPYKLNEVFQMISVSYSTMVDILEQEIISNSSCKPNCVAWHYDVKAGPWSLLWAGHMTQNGTQSKVII